MKHPFFNDSLWNAWISKAENFSKWIIAGWAKDIAWVIIAIKFVCYETFITFEIHPCPFEIVKLNQIL